MQTDLAGVLDHLLTVPQLMEQLLLALEHTIREIRARGLHLVSHGGGECDVLKIGVGVVGGKLRQ